MVFHRPSSTRAAVADMEYIAVYVPCGGGGGTAGGHHPYVLDSSGRGLRVMGYPVQAIFSAEILSVDTYRTRCMNDCFVFLSRECCEGY